MLRFSCFAICVETKHINKNLVNKGFTVYVIPYLVSNEAPHTRRPS